jgi:hypothetical protein
VFDMSGMLDLVQCDGKHYRLMQDGQILDSVHDLKIAALFEIGRLIKCDQLSFKS